jgi:hypothetical protein
MPEPETVAIDLTCAECGRSPQRGEAWRVLFADPGVAVTYCPGCAEREFGDSDSLGELARFPVASEGGNRMFTFRLELTDGTAADPPTFRTSVPNWEVGDTIPLGRDRVLRVIEVRPGTQADDKRSVLVVEDMA